MRGRRLYLVVRWWVKRRTKTVLLWCYSHVISYDEWFLQTRNHGAVEHFVCWNFYGKRWRKRPIQINSVAFSFSRLTMTWWESDTLSVPELVFSFLRQFYFVNHIISFILEIKEVLVHSPTPPSPNVFFFFPISGRGLNGIKRFFFLSVYLVK